MKYVFTANRMSADHEALKSVLEEAGIPCMIRNENPSTALSELTPADSSPEVWIMNDEDYPRAREIVNDFRNAGVENRGSWICDCGEAIEGQFTSCWSCGKERGTA
jgi:hypothetical protein